MASSLFKIQADDGRFWSGDFSAAIDGTSINTMKLLSSAAERFQIITDESGWYQCIVIQPACAYLQWQTTNGHTALTQSDIPAPDNGEVKGKVSAVPPAPTMITFRYWTNDQPINGRKIIMLTSDGRYLSRIQGARGVNYIDSVDVVSKACVFTLLS